MQALTEIPARTWDRITPRGVRPPVAVAPTSRTTVGDKPLVLYLGALYCPYCAVERWPIIAALARFGAWSGLATTVSSLPDAFPATPTFTFAHSAYRSPYVDLRTVEVQSNVLDPLTGRYRALQQPTPAELRLYRRYDPRGTIPFLLVGGRYLWLGSSFSPSVFRGLGHQEIASLVYAGNGAAGRVVLATATEITAAVCATDGLRPAGVCQSQAVRRAIAGLPKAVAR